MPQREFYIDRLRSVMTALVVLHHTAITYGAPGGWFYYELKPSAKLSSLILTLFVATNQAYFMGFFFLLAGYFTPSSLERKGYGDFLRDRFLRLGLPLLAFIFVLGPCTVALVRFAEGRGFWGTWKWLWDHSVILNGPLWFTQALLIFCLGYCVWRAVFGIPLANRPRKPRQVPAFHLWLVHALGVGLAALAIRQLVPTGKNVFGLQLGYFASYIFLFVVGIVAWKREWLRQLQWRQMRPWIFLFLFALLSLPVAIMAATAHYGPGKANFGGGLTWPAIFYALWEPFIAWGLIAGWLLLFRRWFNAPSAWWSWVSRRAYAVYILHPPILVGVSLLLHVWSAPALIKFAVTGMTACTACWLIADPLVRLPGVRKVI